MTSLKQLEGLGANGTAESSFYQARPSCTMPSKQLRGQPKPPRKTAAERETEERRARSRGQAPSPGRSRGSNDLERESPRAQAPPAPVAPVLAPGGNDDNDDGRGVNCRPRDVPREFNYTNQPLDRADRERDRRVRGKKIISWTTRCMPHSALGVTDGRNRTRMRLAVPRLGILRGM